MTERDSTSAEPEICLHCHRQIMWPGTHIYFTAQRGYMHACCAEHHGYVILAHGEKEKTK
jgi:hypothetical protein